MDTLLGRLTVYCLILKRYIRCHFSRRCDRRTIKEDARFQRSNQGFTTKADWA
ncbi:hypothetical protein MnBA_01590 [Marinobacterium sp. BA1]